MEKKYNILYVDDEVSNLHVFKNTFRRIYNVFTAESAKEGLEILNREDIHLILTDQRMPEMTGVEFLKEVIKKYPEPSRILITAFTDFGALKEAVNEARIFQYIQKPWDEAEIQKIIDSALEIHILKQKNEELTEQLKESNEVLSQMNNELLELDKLKYQFLHIISHEIRTPLNGLIGATTLFKGALAADEFKQFESLFTILEMSTERLAHFLFLAERITIFQINRYKIKSESFNPVELIHKMVQIFDDKLKLKHIDVSLNLPEKSFNCFAEKQLIEICFSEIIDNAIKHSEIGSKVDIQLQINEYDILLDITDYGPGFPEIVLNNLFKLFVTHDEYSKQGMGLDLALIKLFIESHQGLISIRNNEPAGATVQLMFKKYAESFQTPLSSNINYN